MIKSPSEASVYERQGLRDHDFIVPFKPVEVISISDVEITDLIDCSLSLPPRASRCFCSSLSILPYGLALGNTDGINKAIDIISG